VIKYILVFVQQVVAQIQLRHFKFYKRF